MNDWQNPQAWQWLFSVFAHNFLREGLFYLLSALGLWGMLHVLLRRKLEHRLIAQWPSSTDIRREVVYSLSTLLIFSAMGLIVFAGFQTGYMTIYFDHRQFGWTWTLLSLPLMILWHDLYFYWTHRLLHTGWLFRRVHGVHHRSRNPSPWAAYSFHPVEALVNSLVTPLALCVFPLHGLVLLTFTVHQIVRNAHGHAAVETMPQGFVRHWLGGRFTTTTHHHLHHETSRGNYGLWFTFWDRRMGTENPQYHSRFDKVTRGTFRPS